MRLCVRLCVYVFMFLCFYAFVLSLPFFAIYCLVKEKQSTRARHESLKRGADYCGPAIESLGRGRKWVKVLFTFLPFYLFTFLKIPPRSALPPTHH